MRLGAQQSPASGHGAVLAQKRKRAVSKVAALLEQQHAEVREVIDEAEDSDVQADGHG